jgi:hypothetical protein
MINIALTFLAQSLNQFLKKYHSLNEDIAVVSSLIEVDGSTNQASLNKIALFLVSIEKDTRSIQSTTTAQSSDGRIVQSSQPLSINLYVMVSANFPGANYQKGLRLLSNSTCFFQRNSVFDHNTSPDLPQNIGKLILDIENLDMAALSQIWGILGGKYVPSVLYKIRMLSINTSDIISLDWNINSTPVETYIH